MTAAIFLLVNGIFNWIVWPPFYRRTARDSRARDAQGRATRFLRVHAILIGSALLLACVSLVIGVLALLRVTN
ncbi:MAG TPA: hypothetical protein VGF80_02000 [Galbitalea sp.]|jgi:hypothetical protein